MNTKSKNNLTISDKMKQLKSNASTRQQFMLVQDLKLAGYNGEKALLELLIDRRIINNVNISYLDSIIFESVFNSSYLNIKQDLNNYFPVGIVDLKSNIRIDYQPLQKVLMEHNYQEADKLTQQALCQLAGLDIKHTRDWLYFTDIALLPSDELYNIDLLWRVYSRYKFGFSRQRQIWLNNNCDWEKFWHQIGWKLDGTPRRYPHEFLWNINAPNGHLPLFNQLRGVQVLLALFNHMAWNK
uniref:Uncharacterized protein n=1 Tax=Riquetophycus sp. TaxID=1897556 RepID=A0A1C9C8A4_9FLOR|nr:hypothetical protein Riqu_122 [Riquetophycus sp.]